MVKTPTRTGPRKTRKVMWALLALALGLGAMGWFYRVPIIGTAQAGTAYGARVACSCRFVAGRTMKDCAKDKLAGMEFITLSDNEDDKSVTARFPLIASDTAIYKEGYGCVLQKWED